MDAEISESVVPTMKNETNQATHTPIPWCIDGEGWIIPADQNGHDRGGGSIAQPMGDTAEERDANAAMIVRAVNAHDALLEALRLADSMLERYANGEKRRL